jgi:hypothetical protein
MIHKVKAFKTQYPVPGFGIGSYAVGKADITHIEIVEHGLLVRKGRGGIAGDISVMTWANILWYLVDTEESVAEEVSAKKKATK